MHDKVNAKEEEETLFDVFCKTVAMQLKKMTLENALRAQEKVQSILTELGIEDYRERSAYEVGTEDGNAVYSYIIQEPEASTQIIATNVLIHFAMQAASVISNTS